VTRVENPHAGQGAVLLDIGADVGAVVVYTPAGLLGAEIEVCPAGRRDAPPVDGQDWWLGEWRAHGHAHDTAPAWPHVAVLSRPTPGGPRPAAVFPGLRAGSYELWLRPGQPTALTVSVSGGGVTQVDWPGGQAA